MSVVSSIPSTSVPELGLTASARREVEDVVLREPSSAAQAALPLEEELRRDELPSWVLRESRGMWWLWTAVAVAFAVGYLATLLQFWAPAHSGVDQNGYFVGGRLLAKTGSMLNTPASDFEYVGAMWVLTNPQDAIPQPRADGQAGPKYFPKYPIGLPLLFATTFWVGDWLHLSPAFPLIASNLFSPVGTALAVLAVFCTTRLIAGGFAGVLAMLVMATSQVTLVLANNPNSHGICLGFVCWGMYFVVRFVATKCWYWGLLGGLLVGYAATIRYTEVLLLMPLGLAVLMAVPYAEGRDAALGRTVRFVLWTATAAACVVLGAVVPAYLVRQAWPHWHAVDLRVAFLVALLIPLPWLIAAARRAARELNSPMQFAVAAAVLTLPAVCVVAAMAGFGAALLALPLVLALPLRFASFDDVGIDWPRTTFALAATATLALVTVGGFAVPAPFWWLAAAAYVVCLLRWRDLSDPGHADFLRLKQWPRWVGAVLALIPAIGAVAFVPATTALKKPALILGGATTAMLLVLVFAITRGADGKRRALLDAPRAAVTALIWAVCIPAFVHLPPLFHDKAWFMNPIALLAFGGVAIVYTADWHRPVACTRPLAALAGWAIPVGAMVAWNLVHMGSLTGYDTTNESDGKAFTIENFLGNWERMARQIHDMGLFFVLPLGVLGLLMLARRSWKLTVLLVTWLVPGVVVYTMYYWAPDRGVSYLRFFLTLFPPLAVSAGYLLWRGVAASDVPTTALARRGSVALPLAAGAVVAIAGGMSTYRAAEGMADGTRLGGQSLESMHRQQLNLANTAFVAQQVIPAGSVVFAENGGVMGSMNYLQFAGDWRMFGTDAFTARAAQRFIMRRGGGDDDPDPLDPGRRDFYRKLYADRTDNELQAEHDKVIDGALSGGRRVFLVSRTSSMRGYKDRMLDRRYATKVVTQLTEYGPPADATETSKTPPPQPSRRNPAWGGGRRAAPAAPGTEDGATWQIVEVLKR
jgi:hypothetical protein